MNNRWKAAILLVILIFYITLSLIESIEYSRVFFPFKFYLILQKSASNHTTTTNPDANTTQVNKPVADDSKTLSFPLGVKRH